MLSRLLNDPYLTLPRAEFIHRLYELRRDPKEVDSELLSLLRREPMVASTSIFIYWQAWDEDVEAWRRQIERGKGSADPAVRALYAEDVDPRLTYPRGRLTDAQIRQLQDSSSPWLRVLTYATYRKRCDASWRSNLLLELEDMNCWKPAVDRLRRLDHDNFVEREKAHHEIVDLGLIAEPAVRTYLSSSNSPEARRRCRLILEAFREIAPGPEFRDTFVVLGGSEHPEAYHLLERLAKGNADAAVTKAAKESMERRRRKP